VVLYKYLSLDLMPLYVYFCLMRLFLLVIGSYYLYRYITGSRLSAMLAAGVLLFSIAPTYLRQNGIVNTMFLTPFTLFFLVKYLNEIRHPRRYLYLMGFVFFTGWSMNIFIPAYFLFNLALFMLVFFALRLTPIAETATNLFHRKSMAMLGGALVLIILMSAPSMLTYLYDSANDGELFPLLRIIQKAGGFKGIMATEIGSDILKAEFTNQLGVFVSYGDLANLIFPDIRASLPYFSQRNIVSEIRLYMGIIPFMLCIIGYFFSKSRYRHLSAILLGILLINMFSFYGVDGKQFNFLQNVFSTLFPPLEMIEVREAFGGFFLMYMCMLASMGFKVLTDRQLLHDLLDRRFYLISAGCACILLIKVIITWFYGKRVVIASTMDLFVLFEMFFFCAVSYLVKKKIVRDKIFHLVIFATIFVELFVYNVKVTNQTLIGFDDYNQYIKKTYSFQQYDTPLNRYAFQHYREPLPASPNVAYGENIIRTKGAMSGGNNHIMFTTKRFYDYYTHVPLEMQMLLSGIAFPIIQFYKTNRVKVIRSPKEVLAHFSRARASEFDHSLFVETIKDGKDRVHRLFEAKNIDQYPNLPYLNRNYIFKMIKANNLAPQVARLRMKLKDFLNTKEYSIHVTGFSPNSIEIHVNNTVEGYLFYGDGWSKYWQAFDGNRELPVRVANYNFKAVFLETGSHSLRFVFNPLHYKFGLMAYCIGFLGTIGIITYQFLR